MFALNSFVHLSMAFRVDVLSENEFTTLIRLNVEIIMRRALVLEEGDSGDKCETFFSVACQGTSSFSVFAIFCIEVKA